MNQEELVLKRIDMEYGVLFVRGYYHYHGVGWSSSL